MLLAVCQEYKIENEIIPKIATCFGGGIGNSGDICGAATGAIMAIGLIRKKSTGIEERLENAKVARTFRQRFKEEMGALKCSELTKLDLTKEENLEGLMNTEIPMTVCFPAVANSFRIVMELLEEDA